MVSASRSIILSWESGSCDRREGGEDICDLFLRDSDYRASIESNDRVD